MTAITVRTFCRVCHAACPLDADVVDGAVIAVRGVPEDPLFEGYTCIKGRHIPDQMSDPDRLRAPLRRRADGTFEATTSQAALDEIAETLQRIIADHGPRSVATYTGTGGYQNSVAVPTARAFHRAIRSRSMYTSVTIDQPAKVTAPHRLGAWEAGLQNFRDADVLLAIGYNPLVSSYGPIGGLQGTNPFTVLRRRRQEGMKLIVVDPRRTEFAAHADIHLQVQPGEDAVLLAGMIRLILADGLIDQEFCDRWVSQIDALTAAVEPFDLDMVADRCRVDGDDVAAAARMFAAGPRGTAGTGTGPNMAPNPSLTEHLTGVLNVICGRMLRAGDEIESGSLLYPAATRRAQVVTPIYPIDGAPARVRDLHGYAGEMPTTTLAEEIITPGEGRIRALIVAGGNPVVAFPDQALTIEAMRDLELLVVIDHRMTATAEFAHYVIAPTMALERADVPHLMDQWLTRPYTNYTDAVVERDGDVLNEWEVYWELATRLGLTLKLPGGEVSSTERPTDDHVIDMAYAESRLDTDTIRRSRGVVHPDLALIVAPADRDASRRFTVAPDDLMDDLLSVANASPATGQFPYRLVSRRMKHVLNSLGSELPALARKGTTNPAFMHPDDLAELGAADGDVVEICSASGTVRAVAAAAPDVKRGVVSMAHSWGGSSPTDDRVREIGSPTNRLVSAANGYDPVTGMLIQSAIAVNICRVDS